MSDKTSLASFFAGLSAVGTTEATSLGFTLESAKAREKLQEYALSQAESYQLLMVAGLYALGSREFSVQLEADRVVVHGNAPISETPFEDLWSYVSQGGSEGDVIGYRLLAIAILTSVRLDQMLWTIESHTRPSQEGHGGWARTFQVSRGEVEPCDKDSANRPGLASGVRLTAKRQALGQIAARFFSRLVGQLSQKESADERWIRGRLLLPQGAVLEVNGRRTTALREAPVLGVLRTGLAPELVCCANTFWVDKEYSVSVILPDPESKDLALLPGADNKVQWVWNGLLMDCTVLGAGMEAFRAFVWSSHLLPDLSFTNLIDNRDKQSLERAVRDSARDLLKLFALDLGEKLRAAATSSVDLSALDPFTSRLAIVKAAIVERIDRTRDRKRLASLNRSLVDCPLFLGSDETGVLRFVSFDEIWARIDGGERVATFQGATPEGRNVPPWPGRPLVLLTEESDIRFLKTKFSDRELGSASQVLKQVEHLAGRGQEFPFPAKPPWAGGWGPTFLSGSLAFQGETVAWCLTRSAIMEALSKTSPSQLKSPSGVLVLRRAAPYFFDVSLGLPPGLVATTEAVWQPTYLGRLQDRDLAAALGEALVTAFVDAMVAREGAPMEEDAACVQLLLQAIATLPATLVQTIREKSWLVTTRLGGELYRTSPREFQARLAALRAPLYLTPWGAAPTLPGGSATWSELPILVLPSHPHLMPAVALLFGEEACFAAGFAALAGRKAAIFDESELAWVGELEESEARLIHSDLAGVRMGVPVGGRAPLPRKSTVEWRLHGFPLRSSQVSLPVPGLRLQVEWAHGYPDSEGTARLVADGEVGAGAVISQCLGELLPKFCVQASVEQIYAADPECVAMAIFELVSEPRGQSLPLFLLASGLRVRLEKVPVRSGVVSYFTSPETRDNVALDSVYLPGSLVDVIPLISDLSWAAAEVERTAPRRSVSRAPEPELRAVSPIPRVKSAQPAESPPLVQSPQRVSSTPPTESAQPVESVNSPGPAQAAQDSPALLQSPVTEKPRSRGPEKTFMEARISPPVPFVVELSPEIATQPLQYGEEASLLIEELAQVQGASTSAHHWAFLAFLSNLEVDRGARSAIVFRPGAGEEPGNVLLSPGAANAAGKPEGRLLLLSALYSIFNRQRGDVTDGDERDLHTRLLQRSRQLWRGSPYA